MIPFTFLCFGSECGDTAALRQIAAFFAEEPVPYRAALKQLLKQGLSIFRIKIWNDNVKKITHLKGLTSPCFWANCITEEGNVEESRRLTGADYTVVVMSGNFVQRGAPALADKRLRTETALHCGADLVLETNFRKTKLF